MKLFTQLLCLLLLSLLCFQCQSPTESTEQTLTATMNGQVANASVKTIYLNTPYGSNEVKVEDGQFAAELFLDKPIFVEAFYNREKWMAYIRPGDEIKIAFDQENFDTSFQMESPLSLENEFLNDLSGLIDKATGNEWDIYAMEEPKMLETVDSITQLGFDAIAEFEKENTEIDADYLNWTKQFVRYSSGFMLSNYPRYHKYAVPADTSYKASEILLARQEKLAQEQVELLGLASYQSVLKAKRGELARELRDADSTYQKTAGYLKASFKIIESKFEDPAIQEYLNYDNINEYLSYEGVNQIEQYYNNFMSNSSNETLKANLRSAYAGWANLREGLAAPDFSYPDIDSLVHSLSDYKGKYVYIDVWATWCGPCIQEHPYLEKIEEQYADNEDIVFMGVSIDTDKTAWNNFVIKKEMQGVQLIADGAWEAKINQEYNIKGIPRFILVDDEGNLIDANAPRPSSDELKDQLKSLLEVKPVTG